MGFEIVSIFVCRFFLLLCAELFCYFQFLDFLFVQKYAILFILINCRLDGLVFSAMNCLNYHFCSVPVVKSGVPLVCCFCSS